MTETPGKYKVEKLATPMQPVYPVPKSSKIVLMSEEGKTVTAAELFAIAYQLNSENPNRKLEYWIRLSE